MSNKQLVGTGVYATKTNINMKIPVQQSYLPVQAIKQPNQEMPKELIYNQDARNLHFDIKLQCSDGRKEWEEKMGMGKGEMANFFEKIQKIQDQLNSYL